MSAIRISRPGIAGTTLIDLGPDTPHRASGMFFYQLHEATVTRTLSPGGQVSNLPHPQNRRTMPYTGPRCGHFMPVAKATCFRRPHNDNDHRSEERVKADIERRRSPR